MENRNNPNENAYDKKQRLELTKFIETKFKGRISDPDLMKLINDIVSARPQDRTRLINAKEKKIKAKANRIKAKENKISKEATSTEFSLPSAPASNDLPVTSELPTWMSVTHNQTPNKKYDDVLCYNITSIVDEKLGEPTDTIYLITTDNLDGSKLNSYWYNIMVNTAKTKLQQDNYKNFMRHRENLPYIIITESQLKKLADQNETILKLWENKQDIPDDKKKVAEDMQFIYLCEPLRRAEIQHFVPCDNLVAINQSEKENPKKRKSTAITPEKVKQSKTNPIDASSMTINSLDITVTDGPAVTRIPPVLEADASLLVNFTATAGDPRLFAANNAATNPPQTTQGAPQEARTSSQIRKS